jgi:hypothetical protein
MREVEEETGVNQLRIIRKLQKTYHVSSATVFTNQKLHTGLKCNLILREPLRGNLRKESKSSLGTSKRHLNY